MVHVQAAPTGEDGTISGTERNRPGVEERFKQIIWSLKLGRQGYANEDKEKKKKYII